MREERFHRIDPAHAEADVPVVANTGADADDGYPLVLLQLGQSVILENGFWSRVERDALRLRGRALGARVELHTLNPPLDELWRRVALRNTQPDWPTAQITRAELESWAAQFESPTDAELALYNPPLVA